MKLKNTKTFLVEEADDKYLFHAVLNADVMGISIPQYDLKKTGNEVHDQTFCSLVQTVLDIDGYEYADGNIVNG